MRISGYDESYRYQAIKGILNANKQFVDEVKKGTKLLYRTGAMIREQKATRQGQYSNTWFLKGNVTNTIQIQSTPNSILKDRIQKHLNSITGPDGGQTKVIEKGGKSILAGLNSSKKSNICPYNNKCMVTKENDCTNSRIVYQVICNNCQSQTISGSAPSSADSQPDTESTGNDRPEDRNKLNRAQSVIEACSGNRLIDAKTQYVGTSNRSCHARSLDHQLALDKGDNGNALVKHQKNEHPSDPHDYSMIPIGSHKFNLHRQILEGLYINEATNSNTNLLNSKSEWGRAKLYRLNIINSQGT